MPSATTSKKRRHGESEADNTNSASKRGEAKDFKKASSFRESDERAREEEGSASDEEGPWRDVEISSAALREACLVATPRPGTSLKDNGSLLFDKCAAASAREKSRRDKQQRRARALETLWKRLKVESKRGLKGKAVRPISLPSSLKAPWLVEQPDAMTLESVEGKGRGWFADQDLPPGVTLLASRPMVAHFENSAEGDSEEDDDDDDEEDQESQESGSEEDEGGGEKDGDEDTEDDDDDNEDDESEENVSEDNDEANEDDDSTDGDDIDNDDPFMVDDATAALVVLLAESLLLDHEDQVAEAEAAGHASPMSDMVMDLFPRSVSEMPHPLPPPPSPLPLSLTQKKHKSTLHVEEEGRHAAWRCQDKALCALMRDALDKLAQSFVDNSDGKKAKKQKRVRAGNKLGADLAARLPEIIRCNALSMDTASELLCFPDPSRGLSGLSGIGLYHTPSFFNHNCQPNVSRYSLGDLMVFRTNQPVPRGTELCISYLPHDLLAETPDVRQQALSDQRKGFSVTPQHDEDDNDDDNDDDDDNRRNKGSGSGGPKARTKKKEERSAMRREQEGRQPLRAVVTVELQSALMAMPARARLEELEYIQRSANKTNNSSSGGSSNGSGDGGSKSKNKARGSSSSSTEAEEERVSLLRSDEKELAVLKAITYAQIGEYAQAQASFEWALRWCHQHLPPNDEQIPVLAAQAAAAKLALQQDNEANGYGASSDDAAALLAHGLAAHEVAFGGGAFWMGVRYQEELLQAPVLPTACARAWGLLTAATEDFRQYD